MFALDVTVDKAALADLDHQAVMLAQARSSSAVRGALSL